MLLLDAVLAIFLIGFFVGYGVRKLILHHHRVKARAILLAAVSPKYDQVF
jgi:hypothetical protein